MNKYLVITALTLMTSFATHAADIKPGKYNLDPAHSKVGFEIPHLVISTVEGKFTQFDGQIIVKDKFEKSEITANIDVASIDTSNTKRDDHLKSPDFFDVKKFPKMTFKSTSIEGKPDSYKMNGDLTIHGVTKKVTLDGKYLGAIKDGYGQNKVAFTAKLTISRKDFGLIWNSMVEAGPTVGDAVSIDLKIEATLQTDKK